MVVADRKVEVCNKLNCAFVFTVCLCFFIVYLMKAAMESPILRITATTPIRIPAIRKPVIRNPVYF
jgi:hypothetical protein